MMDEKKLWTVRELVAELSEFPPDMLVVYNDSEWTNLFSHLNPTVQEVVETTDGEYYDLEWLGWHTEKRRLEAVILNHWGDYWKKQRN